MKSAVTQMLTDDTKRILLGVAVVLTLAGVYLRWHVTHFQMLLEERAKDGRLTEAEARRRIWFYQWSGPVVILTAFVLAAIVLFD